MVKRVIAGTTPYGRLRSDLEGDAFDRLRKELAQGFAAPDSTYHELDAEMVIARNARPTRPQGGAQSD
ncbi:hypothetical protein [Vineibacter terrae]|uniref:hypothetical protein n=1 Tax=Vineibacter terrae TaxID=2586908 RepID=UPI002E3669E4|nr:hypothetical protein [Vineibacter terrae]HEX2885133.1 hypothetical protein [Vineibacter terrae]